MFYVVDPVNCGSGKYIDLKILGKVWIKSWLVLTEMTINQNDYFPNF